MFYYLGSEKIFETETLVFGIYEYVINYKRRAMFQPRARGLDIIINVKSTNTRTKFRDFSNLTSHICLIVFSP